MTRISILITGMALIMTMGLAACGTAAGGGATAGSDRTGGGDTAAGACPQDQPDCIDTPELTDDEPVPIDSTGIEQLRRDAQFYLGAAEAELPDVVRIGRIGDEHFPLTEDYVIGRITVELDDLDDDGTSVVTSATVELPDGPETFQLKQ